MIRTLQLKRDDNFAAIQNFILELQEDVIPPPPLTDVDLGRFSFCICLFCVFNLLLLGLKLALNLAMLKLNRIFAVG